MSLFGALNSAVSGLAAQSAAFSNISDNVANSQTVGFKRTETSFEDYLSGSSASAFSPGAVIAGQDNATSVQGAITQSDDTTAMAISGNGFFLVTHAPSAASPAPAGGQLYTRAGDFKMDSDGYLVNSAGNALEGWQAPTGTLAAAETVSLSGSGGTPLPPSFSGGTVTLNGTIDSKGNFTLANLSGPAPLSSSLAGTISPWNAASAGASAGTQVTLTGSVWPSGTLATSSSVLGGLTLTGNVPGVGNITLGGSIDASGNVSLQGGTSPVQLGTLQPIRITQKEMPPQPTTQVTVAANLPATPASGSSMSSSVDYYDATGTQQQIQLSWTQGATTNGVTEWSVAAQTPGASAPYPAVNLYFGANGVLAGVSSPTQPAGTPATLTTANGITINFGKVGSTDGVTQYAGSEYTLRSAVANGYAAGGLTGVNVTSTGDVMATYDNGQSVRVARVPIATFANPDALQHQDGQAFSATSASGTASISDAGTGGAGSLVAGAVEGSNVDIASEFSKLIVAQQAYSASAKMVTTADQLMQQTLNMKQ